MQAPKPRLPDTLIRNAAICLVYIIAAKIGLNLAFVNASATAVWPPSGIAIASLLIFGFRVWPAILLGAYIANITTAGTLFTSVFIAAGNLSEGLLAYYLIRRFVRGIHAFEHPRSVVLFTVFAGLVSPLVSATIGVFTLSIAGFSPWILFGSVWLTWWLGDAGGILIITPFIMHWYLNRSRLSPRKILEFLSVLGILGIICYLVFFRSIPFPYLVFPVFLWLAFRFSGREVATAIVALAIFATWATNHGTGPFITDTSSTNDALIQLQIFLAVVSITKLIVASTVKERVVARQTLENRERRYRALIEKSAEAVALIDASANIIYASPSSDAILGYSADEMIGKTGLSLVYPDDIEIVKKTLGAILKTNGASQTKEIRAIKKDGSDVWVEFSIRNLLNDPAVGAMVVNYRDITERKRLDEAKNEFLMVAAHQLRTPLGAMRWNMELMFQHLSLSPDLKKKLNLIYSNTKRMIDLVNELLDVSRIMQGKTPNDPVPTRIGDLLQKQVVALLPLAQRRSVKVTVSPFGKLPLFMVDPTRLTAVFQNILSNAIKYTPPGGSVTVSVQKQPKYYHFSVTDTGIGIPKNEQGKLFSKFFRARNARSLHTEGSGLGLFVAKSYIESWSGKIEVESPVVATGKGTAVHMYLPVSLTHVRRKSVKKTRI